MAELLNRTQVHYRKMGETALMTMPNGQQITKERMKEFSGPDHFTEASDFVAAHVAGLTDEQFKGVKNKSDYEKRVVSGRSDEKSVRLWMRLVPAWDWHAFVPVGAPE